MNGARRAITVLIVCIFSPVAAAAQMATAERIEGPGWWPTKPGAARQDYVGPAECATCHRAQAATQQTSSMARTGDRAADSDLLRTRPALTFRDGPFAYSISRNGNESRYGVTDGDRTWSAPLGWAFGAGKVGQSFLFEREGRIHEARVSYYGSIQQLGLTPNRTPGAPKSIEEAAARVVPDAEVRRCFACHTTASTASPARPMPRTLPPTATSSTPPAVNFTELIAGVTCEACHGPGREHVAAMRSATGRTGGAADIGGLFRVRSLSPADSVDFCGSCHATFWDVKLAGEKGIAALRSQPHRLQSSKCWQEGDARLTCVACHDPHQPLVREPGSYDVRCTTCHNPASSHVAADRSARVCKVGQKDCVSCHMPKYEVPGMHSRFTDHLIRVGKN